MTRMVISLDEKDKAWLEQESRKSGKSMAELVRAAISEKRTAEQKSFKELLEATSGTWTQGDGLEYQLKIRAEWDERTREWDERTFGLSNPDRPPERD